MKRCSILLAALALGSCIEDAAREPTAPEPPSYTNRIPVPPKVVSNLGITFAAAETGRLERWKTLSGELVVPEHRQWTVRAPAAGRLLSMAPQWTPLRRGESLATLSSPELLAARGSLVLADERLEAAAAEVAAVLERLQESRESVGEAQRFETACRERLDEVLALEQSANALVARELLEARRYVADAGRTRLEAGIAHDALVSKLASKRLAVEEARLLADEARARIRLLTGAPGDAELHPPRDASSSERDAETVIPIPSPGTGTVHAVMATAGTTVAAGDPLARIAATDMLQFRGFLPESDAGSLPAGADVVLEFTSEHLPDAQTTLALQLPVADDATRMLSVWADVPNGSGMLASGMTARAHVLVARSESPRVLIPVACVVDDGLEAIVFKRDARDDDLVIRTPVRLGARSRERVEVLSGVRAGDVVVVDGVHQLQQTGLGKAPAGGHFHADGTWHAGNH
ncbi:MAG: efflux RND transporter periplasmic adaptor subunit [Planctomycetota bacterium]